MEGNIKCTNLASADIHVQRPHSMTVQEEYIEVPIYSSTTLYTKEKKRKKKHHKVYD